MSVTLTFEIRLSSDYHVSAGHGLGAGVDSALHRDTDGLPVLRGTTLIGLLRDALLQMLDCEPLRQYRHCEASGKHDTDTPRFCGQFDSEQTDCPICRIFGSPRTAKRWHVGSARPKDQIQMVKEGQTLGNTMIQISPHVRVNPRTRRAEPGKLYFREDGTQQLVFQFQVTCDTCSADILEDVPWLVASARGVKHLGMSRRRGQGECEISLVTFEAPDQFMPTPKDNQTCQDVFLNRFETYTLPGTVLPTAGREEEEFLSSEARGNDPVRLQLVVRVDEPLLISGKAEAGNEYRSLDYIPGSALRGAMAGRAAARYDLSRTQSNAYTTFVRLFFRDGIRFSPLYPTLLRKNAYLDLAIPAPFDLVSCELYPGTVPSAHGVQSRAWDTVDHICKKCQDDGKDRMLAGETKPLQGFWSLSKSPGRVETNRATEMHVCIDPRTGRAAEGKLFSFDALAPGQYFVGEMICATPSDWEDLCCLAGIPWNSEGKDGAEEAAVEGNYLTLRLGKANRRGYGQITLWLKALASDKISPWHINPITGRALDPQSAFLLTLLTPAIVPDRWGRFHGGHSGATGDLDSWDAWLKETLGFAIEIESRFCSTQLIDGFNGWQGLPRWRDIALQAGSTWRVRPKATLTLQDLQEVLGRLENEGIGLRRGEGFGRVCFNHPLHRCCEGIKEAMSVELPRVMRSGSIETGEFQKMVEFSKRWEINLDAVDDKTWNAFRHSEFESLARLLRTEMPLSKEAVDTLLDRLGRASELLPPETIEELKVRQTDRAKLDFFAKDDSLPGRETLKTLVAKLAGTAGDSSELWQTGINSLADRIAAKAHEDESEGDRNE